jgi:Periplasmic copper-binding protein (NosD)
MSRIKFLLFLLALTAQGPLASATVTYAVGSCQPKLQSFTTIMGALGATPPPNVVKVCAGRYSEQVVITFPVTLEGVPAGNSDQAVIAVPPGQLSGFNDGLGDFLSAQVSVLQTQGEVNLTNLTVDGTGNTVASPNFVVGVLYFNSPGTMDHLNIVNQNGNGLGVGVWLAGGNFNPSVTVEDSNLQNFDSAGITVETNPQLTTTIKGNDLGSTFAKSDGINLDFGAQLTASISDNLITAGYEGVLINSGQGSVSHNKVVGTPVGIDLETDTVAVTSNTVYNTLGGFGIGIIADSAVAPVTGNTVAQSPIGIYLNCVAGTNVHSNTIFDATYALYGVPSGAIGTNTYYNVTGGINGGGC